MTYEVDDLTPEWLREEVKTGVILLLIFISFKKVTKVFFKFLKDDYFGC